MALRSMGRESVAYELEIVPETGLGADRNSNGTRGASTMRGDRFLFFDWGQFL